MITMPVFKHLSLLSRDKTDTLLLVFTCTLILMPFVTQTPWWINVTALILIVWRGWITVSGHELPKKWVLLTLTVLILAGVYWHFRTWLGKDLGIALLVVLACLKMLEMHARRDAMVVLFVCYFLLVGQLLYSQSLLSAAYLLLSLSFLISTQRAFQYHQLVPPFWRRLTYGFYIVALSIPLALVLFLLFPRFQSPIWGKPTNLSGITGLSESMEPGNVANLALSDQIAFRVKFFGKVPTAPELYWRGVVLETYDGRRWTVNTSLVKHPLILPPPGVAVTQEILLEPHNQRWLFGLDRPVSMDKAMAISQGGNVIVGALSNDWEMRSKDKIQERIRYIVTSHLSNTALGGIRNLAPALKAYEQHDAYQNASQLPAGLNPLTLQWTRQLWQQTNDPLKLVQRVLAYFHEQPFRYTMSPPILGVDQVDDFMFTTQAGFCEHYASSFVVIMRMLGIPARVVTGYQGGEMNPIDGFMTVRQADAHAWAEVWIDQLGWLRVDPTAAVAPSRIERGLNATFPNRKFAGFIDFNRQAWLSDVVNALRQRYDAMNSAWNLWVLNYNLAKQKNLLARLTGIQNPKTVELVMAMMIAAGVIVAAMSLLLLRKPKTKNPLDKVYAEFNQYMRYLGFARFSYEGPKDYGDRLQEGFGHKKELKEFLTLYSECKYGKGYNAALKPSQPDQLTQLKTLLKLCLQLKPSKPM